MTRSLLRVTALRALLPLWVSLCDLMEDLQSWFAGTRPQYAASLLSLREERGVDRGGKRGCCLGPYAQDGEQAAVGLIVLEQASKLCRELRPLGAGRKDLSGKAACQHVLCIGMEGRGARAHGQLPECVPCLNAGAVLGAQRAVAPPACSGEPCRPSYSAIAASCHELERSAAGSAAGSDLRSTAWSLLRAGATRGVGEL